MLLTDIDLDYVGSLNLNVSETVEEVGLSRASKIKVKFLYSIMICFSICRKLNILGPFNIYTIYIQVVASAQPKA